MFGSRWASQFGDLVGADGELSETARVWSNTLSEFNWDSIKRALNECVERGLSWPPTLGEFVEMCRPSTESLGLPDLNRAYAMAIEKDWSNQAVWATVQKINSFSFFRMSEKEAKQEFKKAYAIIVKKIANGEPLPTRDPVHVPSLLIESETDSRRYARMTKEQKAAEREAGKVRSAELKALLRGGRHA